MTQNVVVNASVQNSALLYFSTIFFVLGPGGFGLSSQSASSLSFVGLLVICGYSICTWFMMILQWV